MEFRRVLVRSKQTSNMSKPRPCARAILSSRCLTEAAIFLGVSAIEGQCLQVGPHRAPSASGARGVGDLRRTGLALIERCAQPFDRYRTVGPPPLANTVRKLFGNREARQLPPR